LNIHGETILNLVQKYKKILVQKYFFAKIFFFFFAKM